MPIINILDKSVSELIAAGEVIERPASVAKELVENAVDAGARHITIEIQNGGISFLRVTDDGKGIEPADIPAAFLRHATSKVKNAEDLDHISTMGFRGEALASVAAVAKIELFTKQQGADFGSVFRITGGEADEISAAGCPNGTTLIVRDLFFNTPARLKFLKKDISEGNAIAAVAERMALIYPGIAFKFIRDNHVVLQTGGDGELMSAIYAVFGRDFAGQLLPADYDYSNIRVTGFVGAPLFGRANRTMQYFYVNRRYIRSQTLSAALDDAYRGSMMTGKFPACVLNIDINPADVDVNVHPAKTQVRFVSEKAVFDAVCFAAKNALISRSAADSGANVKSLDYAFNKAKNVRIEADTPPAFAANYTQQTLFSRTAAYNPVNPVESEQTSLTPDNPESNTAGYSFIKPEMLKRKQPALTEPESTPAASENRRTVRFIGELWQTYILCECGEELILIDKHAAHERIRFNQLRDTFAVTSQMLAQPVFVPLDAEAADQVLHCDGLFEATGTEILLAQGGVEVSALPSVIGVGNIPLLVTDIAEILAKNADPALLFDDILHSMACRFAVKAGDYTPSIDLKTLAERVMNDDSLRFCPHGRPIAASLSKTMIERNFGRLG
jgi:DNA mismatch repair protein MutL